MKFQGNDVSNLESWEELRRFTALNFRNASNAINGNLEFGGNIKGTEPISFKITSANQIIQVSFNLPYVPSNFLITFKDANSNIWAANVSQYPWTNQKAFITASAAVSGKIILF